MVIMTYSLERMLHDGGSGMTRGSRLMSLIHHNHKSYINNSLIGSLLIKTNCFFIFLLSFLKIKTKLFLKLLLLFIIIIIIIIIIRTINKEEVK